jgi:hypothetical protein
MFPNVSEINYHMIGYNETDLGLATICLAGSHLLTFLNIKEEGPDGQLQTRELFTSLMSIVDPEWSNTEGEVELSARLCCGIDGDCTLGTWDLETKEIWNVESNNLSLVGDDI